MDGKDTTLKKDSSLHSTKDLEHTIPPRSGTLVTCLDHISLPACRRRAKASSMLTSSQIPPPQSNSHPTRTKAETAGLLPMLTRHNHLRHHRDLHQPIRTPLTLPITSRPSTTAATSPLNQTPSSNLLAIPLPKHRGSRYYLQ